MDVGVMYLASRPATLAIRCGFTKVGGKSTTTIAGVPSSVALKSSSKHVIYEPQMAGKFLQQAKPGPVYAPTTLLLV